MHFELFPELFNNVELVDFSRERVPSTMSSRCKEIYVPLIPPFLLIMCSLSMSPKVHLEGLVMMHMNVGTRVYPKFIMQSILILWKVTNSRGSSPSMYT